ncbi:MAG: hypothetical protein HKP58_09095 [Desulfatitalea sp.]|nr:hypothetical protein [Desulfatitalea sp.]NNK00556.1 hypothetical protein [Desulfatitalea sp.]
MKAVWLSALNVAEHEAQAMLHKMKTYGLEASGHQWQADNQNMSWMGPKAELCHSQCALWAIMGNREAFLGADIRYGVSLLSLSVRAERRVPLPVVMLQTDGDPLTAADLPTPLQGAVVLPAADAGTPAKLVAKAHAKAPDLPAAYHVNMVGDPQLGQWFEVRPTRDAWPGIIFGVDSGEIRFQAVGPAGELPKTSTLNYAMQGLKIQFNAKDFTAWAVRNEISTEAAYFVKVEGTPATLLFGPFSEDSATEMYPIQLV